SLLWILSSITPRQPNADRPMEPIAIVGLAFRLPDGVEDDLSFWDMLENRRNVMQEWPESRANIGTFYKPGSGIKNTASPIKSCLNQLYSRGGYFMKGDPAAFDAPFFSITAQGMQGSSVIRYAEAAAMDPQQRWLLETSYRALENGMWSSNL
ncbi:unnamed protein product, partial [Clonostachys chloroleuca]